jgi:large subunit ribosomal protein L28
MSAAKNRWHQAMPYNFGATPASLLTSNPQPQDGGACRFRSNRSRRGLYDGKDIRSGNNVSFSMRHTKRKFKPNVFIKRVYSEILDDMVRFHLTASTLRSIDKAGGLDNYLLTSKHVTSGEGMQVKERILSKLSYAERVQLREAPTTVSS